MHTYRHHSDTIAAIATPIGVGGIAVIRISGAKAFDVVEQVFTGKKSLREVPSHTIHFGSVHDSSNAMIDTVLVSIFRSPNSYTGDDVAEISTHGGYYVSQKILDHLYQCGARPADPGEFTMRAFLNGKIDLTQAEAVADLIHSRTERAHQASLAQLTGRLSRYIQDLRSKLIDICSLLELELDFSQEGIELIQRDRAISLLSSIIDQIAEIIDTYKEGKVIRDGVTTVFVGLPNVGKSSLLNILLNENRVIVSDMPGTTRDTIEENISLNGVLFKLVDTAGFRHSENEIEKEGIRRAEECLKYADIIVFIKDASSSIREDENWLFSKISPKIQQNAQFLTIWNKFDILHPAIDVSLEQQKSGTLFISCKDRTGIEQLKKNLTNIALPNYDPNQSSIVLTNIRHKNALEKALACLRLTRMSLKDGTGEELIAIDLREALHHLEEIIGIATPEDILNNIFSHFCIGK